MAAGEAVVLSPTVSSTKKVFEGEIGGTGICFGVFCCETATCLRGGMGDESTGGPSAYDSRKRPPTRTEPTLSR